MTFYTIAYDGVVGYFGRIYSKEKGEKIAARYRTIYPAHTYEVVFEKADETITNPLRDE